ncbi:MAG: YchJ family metal-binding protein [Pseudoxanthomonas sp.]
MTRADPNTPMDCPCGLAAEYRQCCGRWHHGPQHLQAPDAESLMRSRYSAYVLEATDYLLETWHPRTRPPQLDPNPPGLRWLGLEVRRHAQLDESHATVEFVARNQQGGRATRLHEISRFERLGGRWIYVDGLIAKPR